MANLATGLNAGLSSALGMYTTLRDENRKSKLFELQSERYGLLNDGSRLDNNLKRETFDSKVGLADAQHDAARYLAEGRLQSNEFDAELQPYKVSQAKNQSSYYGGLSSKAWADATVANNTIGSRTAKSAREADKAAFDARTAGHKADEAQLDSIQRQMSDALGPDVTDGEVALAMRDPNSLVSQGMVKLANLKYGDQVSRGGKGYKMVGFQDMGDGTFVPMVQRPDGKIAPRTVNGTAAEDEGAKDDPVERFSIKELRNLALGNDYAGVVSENTANADLVQGAVARTVQPRAAEAQQQLDSLAAQRDAIPQRVEASTKGQADLAALENAVDEATRSFNKASTLAEGVSPLPFSFARSEEDVANLKARDQAAEELEARKAELEQYRKQLEEQGHMLTPEEAEKMADALDEQITSTKSSLAGLGQEYQQQVGRGMTAIRAGQTPDDVQASLMSGLPVGTTPASTKAVREEQEGQTETVLSMLDNVDEMLGESVSATKTGKDRVWAQERASQTSNALRTFVGTSPIVAELVQSPEGRLRLDAAMRQAASEQAGGGANAAVVLNGLLGGYSAEAIAVGSDIFDNEVWGAKGYAPAAARTEAMQRVMDRVQNGMDPSEAKLATLKEINRAY